MVVGGLFLFLAVQNDRLILGQCESDAGVVLFGYSTRSFGNWATAAQESPYKLALDQIYLQIQITCYNCIIKFLTCGMEGKNVACTCSHSYSVHIFINVDERFAFWAKRDSRRLKQDPSLRGNGSST